MTPVVIVGGGWAGLAAAIELTHHGVPITLYEASQTLGGRARSVGEGNNLIDNGQHLLLGAYREILRLLTLIGVPECKVLDRHVLSLQMQSFQNDTIILRTLSVLPAPLHLLVGLLTAQGFSLGERFAAIRFCINLALGGFTLKHDLPVKEWLLQHHQPLSVTRALWEPLCLAALNTPIAYASAQVFLRVLGDTFSQRRRDADLLFTRVPLGDVFPLPAQQFIEQHGGHVEIGKRVKGLYVRDSSITGIRLAESDIDAEHVILAVTPVACQRLIDAHAELDSLSKQLTQFSYEPICTVYLKYAPSTSLNRPMLGLIGSHTHWLFDHSHYNKPGYITVVISGPGPHMTMRNEELLNSVVKEIAAINPHWPQPEDRYVIREKRATFSCRVDINSHRPATTTPVRGLWLAGDYTNTGYPATLEGAVRSGVDSARKVLVAMGKTIST